MREQAHDRKRTDGQIWKESTLDTKYKDIVKL